MRKTIKTKKVKLKKNINWTRLIIVLIIVALISITITQLVYHYFKYSYKVKEIKEYEMRLRVSDHISFNFGTEAIDFGTVMPGGGAKRFLTFSSSEPVHVTILLEGNLAKWVGVSENDFILEGEKTIAFVASTPENAKEGDYAGKAILIFKKVKTNKFK